MFPLLIPFFPKAAFGVSLGLSEAARLPVVKGPSSCKSGVLSLPGSTPRAGLSVCCSTPRPSKRPRTAGSSKVSASGAPLAAGLSGPSATEASKGCETQTDPSFGCFVPAGAKRRKLLGKQKGFVSLRTSSQKEPKLEASGVTSALSALRLRFPALMLRTLASRRRQILLPNNSAKCGPATCVTLGLRPHG